MVNAVIEYGWETDAGPCSCICITPKVLELLADYRVHRVCDVGSGNGAFVGEIQQAGHVVVGVEYSEDGVGIARKQQSDLGFYNLGVQGDLTLVREIGGAFDALVFTKVVEHLFPPHQVPMFARGLLDKGGF